MNHSKIVQLALDELDNFEALKVTARFKWEGS
jgi:hypothetical protein